MYRLFGRFIHNFVEKKAVDKMLAQRKHRYIVVSQEETRGNKSAKLVRRLYKLWKLNWKFNWWKESVQNSGGVAMCVSWSKPCKEKRLKTVENLI